MYTKLCECYGLDAETNLWAGKCVIAAFAEQPSYSKFDEVFFGRPAPMQSQGLCHQRGDGVVVISCYGGRDLHYAAAVMVHETAHGFTFRYRSPHRVPSWLDEGISDWIADQAVGGEPGIRGKQRQAVTQMRMTGAIGVNDFFQAQMIPLSPYHYGAASCLVDYLVKYRKVTGKHGGKPRKVKPENIPFRKFVDGIKDGTPWEDSLKAAYGMTLDEMVQSFGAGIGAPNLKP